MRVPTRCQSRDTESFPTPESSPDPPWRSVESLPTADLSLKSSPLDLRSLELLHHYISNTCVSLTAPKAVEVWRLTIPSMAISNPFLMHGILALSALHLASLQPHRRSELGAIAFTSEQAALPSFRKFVADHDSESIHAVFAFSSFVVPYTLAVSGLFDGERPRIPKLGAAEPHWFHAMRGTVALLRNNWMDIFQGPFRPVLDKTPEPIDYAYNPDDVHFARLHEMLIPKSSASIKDIRDLSTCRSALDELRRVSALPHNPCKTVILAVTVFVWPGTVSQEYLQLLHDRRPEALVILAHYCVLIKNVNSIWFLRGAGENLLNAIGQELGAEWKPRIQWAVEQPSEKCGGDAWTI